MKRLCLISAVLFCLLLTGCGSGRSEKKFEDFSASMQDRSSLSFTARVRAEYDDRTVKFTLAYAGEGDNCTISVIEPEIISGIAMRFEDGKSVLDCKGIFIDTGFLDENGLTPVNALPLIVKALVSGHLDSCGKDGDELIWYLIPCDGMSVEVHLCGEPLKPVHAELISGGRVRVFCDITDWN